MFVIMQTLLSIAKGRSKRIHSETAKSLESTRESTPEKKSLENIDHKTGPKQKTTSKGSKNNLVNKSSLFSCQNIKEYILFGCF
jgi:hypothetical protein